ncbi:MAG: DUF971 domain-containing protein [Melioribacteraceae bacterium]|nr:DUF971 domain-containing protein [Melioribacteraceae bacterium]
MIPININVNNSQMIIEWNNKMLSKIKLSDLRKFCPCAYCEKERENDHGKFEVYTQNQITIKKINMVGSYALNIIWNDDHSNGFYEFSYLKNISENIL